MKKLSDLTHADKDKLITDLYALVAELREEIKKLKDRFLKIAKIVASRLQRMDYPNPLRKVLVHQVVKSQVVRQDTRVIIWKRYQLPITFKPTEL
jgi:hypothetical protein